ncbi:hypothetical protein P0Y31_12190 [Knoellia sp. 3-2P3]|uniref:hypothetical protein n=1 Tax=unclassified Knoellia TaxID=2618719 RepID=UPI0023DAADF7|nr:hypothetical protein [Knoellia sp. 3-2P3]MDF2093104.1 hypothetical protein [Knoellia sp. 3-2P3]
MLDLEHSTRRLRALNFAPDRLRTVAQDALPPLLIFTATRFISAAFLAAGAADQPSRPRSLADATITTAGAPDANLWTIGMNWDAQWYKSIAEDGYPSVLPQVNGEVLQNELAFYPAYPLAVRAISWMTGLEYEFAAPAFSLACAGLAMVLLYKYLVKRASRFTALALIACINVYPAAPIFQVGYTEGLALLLLVIFLYALSTERYLLVSAAAILLSLTRPIAFPLLAVLAVHGAVKWRRSAGKNRAFDIRGYGVATAVTAVSSLLWPAIAALLVQRPDAFFVTQAQWMSNQGPGVIGLAWPMKLYGVVGWPGVLVLLGAGAYLALTLCQPRGSAWPLELRAWAFAYPMYIAAVTPLAGSGVRYLLLSLAPLWPMPTRRRDRLPPSAVAVRAGLLVGLIVVGLYFQYLWTVHVYAIHGSTDEQAYP